MEAKARDVVVVDGCRIPFQKSGTGYQDLISYDLGKLAVKGLLHKTQLDAKKIDHLIMGTVIADVTTSNLAREVALSVGIGNSVPAHTITMACISSNMAFTEAVNLIKTGEADIVIVGGADTLSDFPIRYRKKFRKNLMGASKYRSLWDFRKLFRGLKLRDLLPEVPNIAEFSTGLSMGKSCERIAAAAGATRQEQDQYALLSHQRAAQAYKDGKFTDEIYPVRVPPKFRTVEKDNGFREDSSIEKLAKLRPTFVRKYGTITAGNSSFFTDGASAVLVMANETAEQLGYKPKAKVHSYVYTAHEPKDQLLLGPAFAVPKVLDKAGLKLSDVDVFEFHEAFAAQVVSVLKCLDSDKFAQKELGKSEKIGEVPMDKLNMWGGSLSLGHPFGATGTRLVTTAVNRLADEDGKFALIASCAAGAMAHAIILER